MGFFFIINSMIFLSRAQNCLMFCFEECLILFFFLLEGILYPFVQVMLSLTEIYNKLILLFAITCACKRLSSTQIIFIDHDRLISNLSKKFYVPIFWILI